jgi:UDP-glucose 4-epimerase
MNVQGTLNVLTTARAAGVKRVVFTSSREVYGDPNQLPVPETAVLVPKNAYGASKVAGEAYCRSFTNDGLETVILRLAMSTVLGITTESSLCLLKMPCKASR